MSGKDSSKESLALVASLQGSPDKLATLEVPQLLAAVEQISKMQDKPQAASLLQIIVENGYRLPTEIRHGHIPTVTNPVAEAAGSAFRELMATTPGDFEFRWLMEVATREDNTEVRIAAGLRAVNQVAQTPDREQAATGLNKIISKRFHLPTKVVGGFSATKPVNDAACKALAELVRDPGCGLGQDLLMDIAQNDCADMELRFLAASRFIRQSTTAQEAGRGYIPEINVTYDLHSRVQGRKKELAAAHSSQVRKLKRKRTAPQSPGKAVRR
jgi:hypothetical protein